MSRGEHARDEAAAQQATLEQLLQQPAARLVGLQARTLRDSDAPRNKDGTYDGRKLVKWLVQREKSKRKGIDLKQVERELQQEKLRQLRRENDVEEGHWYRRDEVDAFMVAIFRRMGERARVIERAHGAEVGAAYREMIDEAIKDLNDGKVCKA